MGYGCCPGCCHGKILGASSMDSISSGQGGITIYRFSLSLSLWILYFKIKKKKKKTRNQPLRRPTVDISVKFGNPKKGGGWSRFASFNATDCLSRWARHWKIKIEETKKNKTKHSEGREKRETWKKLSGAVPLSISILLTKKWVSVPVLCTLPWVGRDIVVVHI